MSLKTDTKISAPVVKKVSTVEPSKAIETVSVEPAGTPAWQGKPVARVSTGSNVSLAPQSSISNDQLLASVAASKAGLAHSTSAVDATQLRRMMPNLSASRAEAMVPHLNRAMQEAGITTPKRAAAFVAQLAHESGELRHFEELASGHAYEGRRDLGNTQPGDGARFKGRGPIQLTGRANYAAASKALGIDLVNNPELASRPDVGFRVAAWYWKSRGLNELADSGDFDGITKRINGGMNGASERRRYLAMASDVLGAGFTGGPVATNDTPAPPYDAKPERTYRTGRPGAGQPAGGASAPDAGYERMIGAYASRANVPFDFVMYVMQAIIESIAPDDLASNEAFQKFAQEAGADWKPGQPVPQALAAEFLASEITKRAEAGQDAETIVRELTPKTAAAAAPAKS